MRDKPVLAYESEWNLRSNTCKLSSNLTKDARTSIFSPLKRIGVSLNEML